MSSKSVLAEKFHSSIKVMLGLDNFQKMKFKIFLTWQPFLVISVIVPQCLYHLPSVPRSRTEDEGGPLGAGFKPPQVAVVKSHGGER